MYNLGSNIKWISEKEQDVAGKGRPTVDDKRDNQYRVRLNDEEDQMLTYCSKATGKPKSQIFRKALSEYYATVRLNELNSQSEYDTIELDGISMKRVIECPYCGAANAINLADYSTDECTVERQMGRETQHWFDCDAVECAVCGQTFRVNGCITEYPIGAYDSEIIDVTLNND